ncbi:MAG: hypothetical protein SF053_15740 [Bacteroidia bacterium]|nr:hypothetical protein [Bacteroidia bacterium]
MVTDIAQAFQAWLQTIGIPESGWEALSVMIVIVTLIFSLLAGMIRLSLGLYGNWRDARVRKDLHPYFSAEDIRNATRLYVPTFFQSNAPSHHSELIQSHRVTARQKLIPFFLNVAFKPGEIDQRFYIVLAGSGMGKTTFMINLYVRYLQHKRFRGAPYEVRLLPLGYPNLLKRIEEIPNQEHTILLLDGLDEDTEAMRNYKARLDKILDKVQDFRVVVFTCRTQFFPTERDEPLETEIQRFGRQRGYQTFARLYLSPFSDKDIGRYLNKKYRWYQHIHKANARKIIARSPNLMVRPMILSYIDDLLGDPDAYTYTSHVYQVVIKKWINREAERVPADRRERFRGELMRFSREVALDMYRQRKNRNGLFIPVQHIRPFAERNRVDLNDIEIQSRSLLNRNALGEYKFAHKSILEYFLALEAIENRGFAESFDFSGLDLARTFYEELCMTHHTLPMFRRSEGKGVFRVGPGPERELADARQEEFRHITHLYLDQLAHAEGLRPLHQLQTLRVQAGLRDLAPLAGLKQLTDLDLRHTEVDNLKPLEGLIHLSSLHLDHTPVQSLAPLRSIQGLRHVSCAHTSVSDLTPLEGAAHLETLAVHHTAVRDLSPLRKLTHLREITLSNTAVSSLAPLRDGNLLEVLLISQTGVNNLSVLRDKVHLRRLYLSYTAVTQLKPVAQAPLEELRISGLPLADLSCLGDWPQLRILAIRETPVRDFSPLADMSGLEELYLDDTSIADLADIARLPHLRRLSIRRTRVTSLRPLEQLASLRRLELIRDTFAPEVLTAFSQARPEVELVTRMLPHPED